MAGMTLSSSTKLLLAVLLALTLAACGGGGGAAPAGNGNGLTSLDLDLTSNPGSEPPLSEITTYEVDLANSNYSYAVSLIPPDQKVVGAILLQPETAPGDGFSGDATVRLKHKAPSAARQGSAVVGTIYRISGGTATPEGNTTDTGNGISFSLDFLGFIVITEPAGPPFNVSAFADLSLTSVGTDINFRAIVHGGEGEISLSWDFGDGSAGSGDQLTHAYSQPGLYQVAVVATDSTGRTAHASSTPIDVRANPVPLQGVDVTVIKDSDLSFTYSATVQGGNPPLAYGWDFDGDGTVDSSAGAVVSFGFADYGFYFGHLLVTDSLGNTATADFESDARKLVLSVADPSIEAPATIDIEIAAFGLTSDDVIDIDFGDGTAQTDLPFDTASVPHDYNDAGTFTVVATARRVTVNGTAAVSSNGLVITAVDSMLVPALQVCIPINPAPGEDVVLYGYDLGATQGNRQLFAGAQELTVVPGDWSDTRIKVKFPTLPGGATDWRVSAPAGDSNGLHITPAATDPDGIQNVLPAVQNSGGRILLIGHGFGTAQQQVTCDGTDCTIEEWSDHAISAVLPVGLANGSVDIEIVMGGGSLNIPLTIGTVDASADPQISNASPAVREFGAGGTTQFVGAHYGDGTASLLLGADGTELPVSAWATGLLRVGDPPAPFDAWAVVIRRDRISNPQAFAVIRYPQIDSLNPSQVERGGHVVLAGHDFGAQMPGDRVMLGTLELPVTLWSDTSIEVDIPNSAVDGDVVVQKKLDSNAVPLDIIPSTPGQPGLGQI